MIKFKSGEPMSYLVCEQCGKYYELNEGKSSFSYDKCECGGKLTYTESLNGTGITDLSQNSDSKCEDCGVENPPDSAVCNNCGKTIESKNQKHSSGLSLVGVAVGFGFLLLTTLIAVLVLFGSNIPLKPEDIPYNILIAFGIIAMVVSIVSGLISSYIGGSTKFKDGIINGGLVGVVLGILVGITSGSIASIGVLAVFGFLSVVGGVIGTVLKRKL